MFLGPATLDQNIKDIPGGLVYKRPSQEAAQAIYDTALANGEVVKVAITREILT